VRFYFTGTEFLYDYNANLSKALAAKRLPLTILCMVEERLLRLQAEFTQLTPDLLNTTTGLYQLKDSVGRLQRKLRARQARHRSQSLQD